MSTTDDAKIAELKKEVRKAERNHRYYQKEYGAKGGLSMPPYQKLAVIYRKQKDYEAEVAVLERYFEKNGAGYPDGTTGGVADLFKRLERARELLAIQKAAGPDSKSTCQ